MFVQVFIATDCYVGLEVSVKSWFFFEKLLTGTVTVSEVFGFHIKVGHHEGCFSFRFAKLIVERALPFRMKKNFDKFENSSRTSHLLYHSCEAESWRNFCT